MATNIEIKARIHSVEQLLPRAAAIASSERVDIVQDDTFFACPEGRLKLRAFDSRRGELIYYSRPNQAGPKPSFYTRSATTDPDGLRTALDYAYGSVGRVRKQRILYRCGRTRIHLDQVEGLGDFLELEVVLDDDDTDAGIAEAYRLMHLLGVSLDSLVDVAYIDLVREFEH